MNPYPFNFDLLKLEPASGYDLDVTGIAPELHNLFKAFRSNIDRVYNVIRIPSSIIENIGSYFAKWETIKHHLDYRSKKETIDVNVELQRIFTDSNLHLFDALDKETYSYFQKAIQEVKALQETGEDYALKMPVEVMHAKLNQLIREGSATNGFFDGIVKPVLEKLRSNLLKNSRIQD